MNAVVPTRIELHPDRLRVQWEQGAVELPASVLRASCRCGGCRADPVRGLGKGSRLADAVPVGQYALQLVFSDGHDRGIYPWALLRQLADDRCPPGDSSSEVPV